MVSVLKSLLFFIVGISVSFFEAQADATNNCYSQICLNCPASQEKELGPKVRCENKALVDTSLYGEKSKEDFEPGVLIKYACLKMVASYGKSNSDSPDTSSDIVRGCVVSDVAQSVCDGLIKTELAKGKTNARCSFCSGDYCNGSRAITASIFMLMVSFVISKIIYN